MVSAYIFVSFVLPKGENDSPSLIIGDGFLDPYNVDYVGQPLNHRVPALFEQFCSDGTYSRGTSIFETLEPEFYFTACDVVSVRVRIRRCLFSITLEFGSVASHGLLSRSLKIFPYTQAVFRIGESRTVFSLDGR